VFAADLVVRYASDLTVGEGRVVLYAEDEFDFGIQTLSATDVVETIDVRPALATIGAAEQDATKLRGVHARNDVIFVLDSNNSVLIAFQVVTGTWQMVSWLDLPVDPNAFYFMVGGGDLLVYGAVLGAGPGVTLVPVDVTDPLAMVVGEENDVLNSATPFDSIDGVAMNADGSALFFATDTDGPGMVMKIETEGFTIVREQTISLHPDSYVEPSSLGVFDDTVLVGGSLVELVDQQDTVVVFDADLNRRFEMDVAAQDVSIVEDVATNGTSHIAIAGSRGAVLDVTTCFATYP
jgi:hypothetical protein